MDYQSKVKSMFGAEWEHYSLRTLFDKYSAEWKFTELDEKYEILLSLNKKKQLIDWVKEYEYYFKFNSSKTYVVEGIEPALKELTWNCPYDDVKHFLKKTLKEFLNLSDEEISRKEEFETKRRLILNDIIMSKGNLENSIEDNSVIINGRENIVIQNSTGEITINKNYIENRKSALLGLVDISIKKDLLISQNPFPILDIKVRNNSDEAIFINKIEIECIKSWQLAWKKDYYLMPVSHRYDFIITEEDSCIIEDLSQFVRPNYVDRFEVRLASERGIPLGEEGISPHLIRFTLVYNEDMKRVTSRKMLLDIPSKNQMEGGHFMGKTRKEELHLMEVANEVLHSIDENTIFDKKYVDVIKSWAS